MFPLCAESSYGVVVVILNFVFITGGRLRWNFWIAATAPNLNFFFRSSLAPSCNTLHLNSSHPTSPPHLHSSLSRLALHFTTLHLALPHRTSLRCSASQCTDTICSIIPGIQYFRHNRSCIDKILTSQSAALIKHQAPRIYDITAIINLMKSRTMKQYKSQKNKCLGSFPWCCLFTFNYEHTMHPLTWHMITSHLLSMFNES